VRVVRLLGASALARRHPGGPCQARVTQGVPSRAILSQRLDAATVLLDISRAPSWHEPCSSEGMFRSLSLLRASFLPVLVVAVACSSSDDDSGARSAPASAGGAGGEAGADGGQDGPPTSGGGGGSSSGAGGQILGNGGGGRSGSPAGGGAGGAPACTPVMTEGAAGAVLIPGQAPPDGSACPLEGFELCVPKAGGFSGPSVLSRCVTGKWENTPASTPCAVTYQECNGVGVGSTNDGDCCSQSVYCPGRGFCDGVRWYK
jgi:hypothetical protein